MKEAIFDIAVHSVVRHLTCKDIANVMKGFSMELTNLISKLTEYYRLNGISASGDFTCIHKKKCMDASIKFEFPREPDLGPHYGKNIPKLLFLSLDRGWSAGDKTIQRRLNWKPGEWIAKGKVKSAHWYRTCEIAYYILCRFDHSLKELTVEDMVGYFAHVNSAKCCQLKDKGAQADSTLFHNCKEYLKEEIIIFEPDIVITQGDKAKVSIIEHYCKDNKLIEEKNLIILKIGLESIG